MDQFPLGKGKSVWLIPSATASIVLSLYTNTGAGVCRLKTSPHLVAFSHPATLFFHASCDLACFPKHTAELVMGLTEAAKT